MDLPFEVDQFLVGGYARFYKVLSIGAVETNPKFFGKVVGAFRLTVFLELLGDFVDCALVLSV